MIITGMLKVLGHVIDMPYHYHRQHYHDYLVTCKCDHLGLIKSQHTFMCAFKSYFRLSRRLFLMTFNIRFVDGNGCDNEQENAKM